MTSSTIFFLLACFVGMKICDAVDDPLRLVAHAANTARVRNRRSLKDGVHHHHDDHHDDHHGDHHDNHHHDPGAHQNHSHEEHEVAAPAEVSEELNVWSTISGTDKFGCVAKLSCNLQHMNTTGAISAKGQALLDYITKVAPDGENFYKLSVMKAPYLYACFIGWRYPLRYCSVFFPDCGHSMEVMENFVDTFQFSSSP